MPTEPRPISLFEIAKRAVEIADPADRDLRLGDLLAQFEDADEPVTAIENLEERVSGKAIHPGRWWTGWRIATSGSERR